MFNIERYHAQANQLTAGEDELDVNGPIPSPSFPVLSPVARQLTDDEAKKEHLKVCAALKGAYPHHENFEPRSETAAYIPFRGYGFDAFEVSDLNDFDFDFNDWILDETV